MVLRGESALLTAIIFIGVALVIGVAMLSYFTSIAAYYKDQVDLSNHLQNEASNILVNVVSYDTATSSLWFLFKRADGSRSGFFVIVDTGSEYLNCSNIYVSNPYHDKDGILCNSNNDCIQAVPVYRGSMKEVYIPWEGGIADFFSYAKTAGYTLSDTVYVCRLNNVCEFSNLQGLCTENTIVRIQLPSYVSVIRLYTVAIYSNKPYVIGVYEVAVS